MTKRANKRRLPRLKGQTINRLLPTIVTIGALCAGISSIRFAIEGDWRFAVLAIFIAAVLDALDGMVARLLKSTSNFGAEIDSLADIVSFGVAPALTVYFWGLTKAGGLGWMVVAFFIVCCGLRLARFNSRVNALPHYASGYFSGVPAPSGAILALLPMIISFEFGSDAIAQPLVPAIWMVVVSLLMVSALPTYSLKRLKVPHGHVLSILALAGLLAAGFTAAPWLMVILCACLYILSFPLSMRSYHRLRKEAVRLAGKNPDSGQASEQGSGEENPEDWLEDPSQDQPQNRSEGQPEDRKTEEGGDDRDSSAAEDTKDRSHLRSV